MESPQQWSMISKDLRAKIGAVPKNAAGTNAALKSSGMQKLFAQIDKAVASAEKADKGGDLKTLSTAESDLNKLRLDFLQAGKTVADAAGKDATVPKGASQAIGERIRTCNGILDDLKAEIADARSNLSHTAPEPVEKFVPPKVFQIAATRTANSHAMSNFLTGPLYTVSWADNTTEIPELVAQQKVARTASTYLDQAHAKFAKLQSATKMRKEVAVELKHFFDAADQCLNTMQMAIVEWERRQARELVEHKVPNAQNALAPIHQLVQQVSQENHNITTLRDTLKKIFANL